MWEQGVVMFGGVREVWTLFRRVGRGIFRKWIEARGGDGDGVAANFYDGGSYFSGRLGVLS